MSMRYPGGLIAPTPVNQQYPSGVWTGPQSAPYQANNVWGNDSSFKNTTLLLHGDGATTPFIKDASTNNFQITLNGDTKPNNLTPFITNGYWSNFFSATGSYLSVPYSADFNLTGDFTIEFWMNPTNLPTSTGNAPQSYCRVFSFGTYNAANSLGLEIGSNDSSNIRKLISWYNGTQYSLSSNNAVTTNTWQHIALVRSGTTITCYVNGTSTGLTITGASAAVNTSQSFYIATLQSYEADSSAQYAGYLSNFSILKGTAKYTGNFTPTTSPLSTSATNQTLLTCYGNRFYDANTTTTAKTITATGSPSVTMQQPFTAPSGTSLFGSGYFDGTGDSLTLANNAAFNFGANNFTIEAWVYVTATPGGSGAVIVGKNSATYPGGYEFNFVVDTGRTVFFGAYTTTLVSLQGAIVTSLNSWNHVAAVRSGSNWALFVNGVRDVTATSSGTIQTTSSSVYVGDYGGGSRNLTGYISNVRLVNGSAVYDPTVSTLTVPTSPLATITNTQLLTLQTNGPKNNNGFLDNSLNSFPITRTGNTTQGAFSPYGSNWSNYYDGSSHLTTAASASLQAGTGAFTIEGWINIVGTTSSGSILSQAPDVAGGYGVALVYSSGANTLSGVITTTSTPSWSASITPVKGVWYHVALVRDASTNIALFINGVKITPTTGGSTNTTNITAFNSFVSGSYFADNPSRVNFRLNGYVSNARFVKGSAVYDPTAASITVPTSQLTAVTNTQLLILQANRIYDGSANAFAITYSGTRNVQRFSGFQAGLQYGTQPVGGSGYFDGSGDYLVTPNNSSLYLSTNNFTVEIWVYLTSSSSSNIIRGTAQYSFGILYSGGSLVYYLSANGSTWGIANGVSMGSIALNTWTHVALVRNGSTFTPYINGVAGTTATSASAIAATNGFYVFAEAFGGGSGPSYGYCSDFRVVNGLAIYTSAFTPPTAPLTAIANTQLLLNYTNAAIFDNSGMNDLETVGNAQISTSVVKYGTSSMYFDGTGDGLQAAGTQNTVFGTGDFTVEFWINLSANMSNYTKVVQMGSSGNDFTIETQTTTNVLNITNYTSTVYLASSTALTLNVWTHVAVTRTSGTLRIFQNGIQTGSVANTTDFANTGSVYIGQSSTGQAMNGYLDDLRITKGVARYVTNFTPPVARMPNQ